MNFPWRSYNTKTLADEYVKLKRKLSLDSIDDFKVNRKITVPYCYIGNSCLDNFFQYEIMSTPSQGKISCVDFWKGNKKKIISYYNEHSDKDLYRVIRFFNHPPSHFPMLVAATIYKLFNSSKIFDPFAGWGDRCLAAMSLNLDYTGVDSTHYNKTLNTRKLHTEKLFTNKDDILSRW